MSTAKIVLLVGVAGLLAYAAYAKGRSQAFVGVAAFRAGAASYVSQLGNAISPTCCTGCQGGAPNTATNADIPIPTPATGSTVASSGCLG